MKPEDLTVDELKYELEIRHILGIKGIRDMRRALKKILTDEADPESVVTKTWVPEEMIEAELRLIVVKLEAIVEKLDERPLMDEKMILWSRLVHLFFRVARIKALESPLQNEFDGLSARIKNAIDFIDGKCLLNVRFRGSMRVNTVDEAQEMGAVGGIGIGIQGEQEPSHEYDGHNNENNESRGGGNYGQREPRSRRSGRFEHQEEGNRSRRAGNRSFDVNFENYEEQNETNREREGYKGLPLRKWTDVKFDGSPDKLVEQRYC